ncbi:YjjG family noncanonical pyrimidine nucleotidase [Vagococcus silagei]|uniref:Noncanonical pyrimidine nucleotidase, YjjG family n=1 Tax=Vagococcus silagei TaxID=2508885 RepID=A0A4V3TV72_9ENTE|nr:YjjG family noncanonical pyrimidine nucleotidase [Vagococcus silagei]THB61769.1 noncanonical pyrimidine nucleotidase, YjjG family [Vagococcus silagei]
MTKYKYLIFDLDNTLLDFTLSERFALEKIFTTYGIIYNDETVATYKEINGKLWKKLEEGRIEKSVLLASRFRLFFESQGLEVDGAIADEEYRGFLADRADSILGARALLESVQNLGFCILSGTNGIGKTQRRRLENNSFSKYFDKLFISEELGFEKPDVRFFDYIFNDLQIKDHSEVLMIGDSLSSDILGANRVGIDSVWFNPDRLINDTLIEPTFEVAQLQEITDRVLKARK